MAKTQSIWGLDLGRCALKAVKIRPLGDGKVEIVAHDHIEHSKILSQADTDRDEMITAALEKFLSRNDVSKDAVVIGVPGQHTLARFTKLPPVAPKRVPDIVRYEADQQIPFDMDEVIWDYQTFQKEGAPDLEVGIFAMKRELLREHLLHFEQATIEPVAVQCTPLAVYNAAHFDGLLADEAAILLDIGAENTDLVIADADTFWTRTVPIGGNHFTEALVKSFKLTFSKAEGLKRSAESSKYARQIFQAMRPVFADLVQELQRSIGFYSSTHRDTAIESIYCFGDACKLPGLHKYLHQNLGLPLHKTDSFKTVSAAAGAVSMQTYGVAFGLAVQALDNCKVSCNLLPASIAKQIIWRKKKPAFAAAAACILIAGGLVWFRQVSDMSVLAAGAAVQAPQARDVDDAWTTITNGPDTSLPDRAQAVAILSAGTFLKRELGKLAGKGDTERRHTEEIITLQQNKAIVPKILSVIHESLPAAAGSLAGATTQEAALAAIKSGAPARGQRKQVYIDKLHMQFEPDVNAYEWESMVTVEEPINDPETPLSAIKIELTCRTTNEAGAKFISETFMDAMRRNGRRAGQGFYFDRVFLFDGQKVEVVKSREFSTIPRSRRGVAAGAAAVAESLPPEAIDPVTLEPIENDWSFTIWVDAILEDAPELEMEEDETSTGD